MTRRNSLAIGAAVLLAVAAATVALALNFGFVADSSAGVAAGETQMTTTTSYEQYLADYYAENPIATSTPAQKVATATVPPDPVVVYEYLDVPVTVPAPEIVYVEVPTEVPTTTVAPKSSPAPTASGPTPNPSSSSGAPPPATPPPAPKTTTSAPTTSAPTPKVDLLEFDFYGFADITVASVGPGQSLQVREIEQDSPWVWDIERDNGSLVEVKFFNTSSGKEAKFELQIRGDGYRLTTEGDGLPERQKNL